MSHSSAYGHVVERESADAAPVAPGEVYEYPSSPAPHVETQDPPPPPMRPVWYYGLVAYAVSSSMWIPWAVHWLDPEALSVASTVLVGIGVSLAVLALCGLAVWLYERPRSRRGFLSSTLQYRTMAVAVLILAVGGVIAYEKGSETERLPAPPLESQTVPLAELREKMRDRPAQFSLLWRELLAWSDRVRAQGSTGETRAEARRLNREFRRVDAELAQIVAGVGRVAGADPAVASAYGELRDVSTLTTEAVELYTNGLDTGNRRLIKEGNELFAEARSELDRVNAQVNELWRRRQAG